MNAPADPERPRALLEEVLARPEFHNAADDNAPWLHDVLERLIGAAGRIPSWVGDVVMVGIVVVAGLMLLGFLADFRGRRRRAAGGLPDDDLREEVVRTAREWYDAAEAARSEGRPGEAVVLYFRAMIARLVERGFLLPDPSRTNREHARDLRARPQELGLLRAALPAFERVRYGGREAAAEDAERAGVIARKLLSGVPS